MAKRRNHTDASRQKERGSREAAGDQSAARTALRPASTDTDRASTQSAAETQSLEEPRQPPEFALLTSAISRGRAVPLATSIGVMEIVGLAGIAVVAMLSLFLLPLPRREMLAASLPICLAYVWAGVGLSFATSALRQWWPRPVPELVIAIGTWMAMVAMTIAASCTLAAVLRAVAVVKT